MSLSPPTLLPILTASAPHHHRPEVTSPTPSDASGLLECDSDDGDSLQTPLQDPLSAALPRFASSPHDGFAPLVPLPTDDRKPSFEHVEHAKLPFSPTHRDFPSPAMHPSCSAPAALGIQMESTGLNLRLPYNDSSPSTSALFSLSPSIGSSSTSPRPPSPVYGRAYSLRFPRKHVLDPNFDRWYRLGDELGAGGYGFVMTAIHRLAGHEVAVKFIIKEKVPEHAWMDDRDGKSVPTEALLLGLLDHPNIVRCLDLFEDELYFYLVQELHGTPWVSKSKAQIPVHAPSSHASTPSLTPSPSIASEMPPTPPPASPVPSRIASSASVSAVGCTLPEPDKQPSQSPELLDAVRPTFQRRPSHDLFECIEQSSHKRLSEAQARFVFAQVVEAVAYLDAQGVTHCDIKDENILVDDHLNVKLVDFGSAVVVDPDQPRPHYTVFFGTTAYAASEVLRKKPYRAPPAEIWTLGVLLSYLLTGASPFPTERDAIQGRVVLHEKDGPGTCVSDEAEDLMLRCLEPEPADRATIEDVRTHSWLRGAFDLPAHARVLA